LILHHISLVFWYYTISFAFFNIFSKIIGFLTF
jgi:hypothetical protein